MRKIALCIALAGVTLAATAQPAGRSPFNEGWTFEKDGASRVLNLPHDWGVEGAFRQEYPGETGKLPWWGKASYRKSLEITEEELATKDIDLEIDGAMSYATVEVNGIDLGGWPYGYASFAIRLNPALKAGKNDIVIRLDNPEESSRWYPGGGLYRNVWLTKTLFQNSHASSTSTPSKSSEDFPRAEERGPAPTPTSPYGSPSNMRARRPSA